MNASRHIVGTSQTATGEEHAFLSTPNDGMVDLGTLGDEVFSEATAVNALGHVAGSSKTPSGETHAFFSTPSMGMIDLGTLPGSASSRATALNDSDQVVGQTSTILLKALASLGRQQRTWVTLGRFVGCPASLLP